MKKIIILIMFIVFIYGAPLFTHAQSLNGSTVDIVWESNSYTPPFYKGKALKTGPEKVKVVAFAKIFNFLGRKLNKSSLYYKWIFNGRVIGSSSGIGRNVAVLSTSLRNEVVKVVVSSSNEKVKYAEGEVIIENYKPEIVVYNNSPLFGITFNKSVDTEDVLSDKEVTLTAFPFFFDVTTNNNSRLDYVWKLNGDIVAEGGGKSDLVFERVGSGGVSFINLDVDNLKNVFEDASFSFKLNLGEGS